MTLAIRTDRRNKRVFSAGRMTRKGIIEIKHQKARLFYFRLAISAVIIIAAAILKWTAAPNNSRINSIIENTIRNGISYTETVNTLGRVIIGETDAAQAFSDLTRLITNPDEETKPEEETKTDTKSRDESESESPVNNDPGQTDDDSDAVITKDYYISPLSANIRVPEIELLSFDMTEDELNDDTLPVPFEIPAPSNCSYRFEKPGFKYKAPLYGVVTSSFGYRDHPFGGDASFHTGIDIAAKKGTPVKAFAAGTVSDAGTSNIYGKYVLISHPGGFYSFYGHNSKLNVKKGTKVKLGDKIAEVGSTGVSTGPHLHFEVRKNTTRLNPKHYISADCV